MENFLNLFSMLRLGLKLMKMVSRSSRAVLKKQPTPRELNRPIPRELNAPSPRALNTPIPRELNAPSPREAPTVRQAAPSRMETTERAPRKKRQRQAHRAGFDGL